MRRLDKIAVILFCIGLAFASYGCGFFASDDEDGTTGVPPDDDDTTGDDDSDSDDDDDATDDDDDVVPFGDPPEILSALFQGEGEQQGGNQWWGVFSFNVCDPDDDILGGQVRMYEPGTNIPLGYPSDIGEVSGPATDCDHPLDIWVGVFWPYLDPPHCIDFEFQDAAGNISERWLDLCIIPLD
jgi:hypothetical protein